MIDVDEWRQVVGVDATAGDREAGPATSIRGPTTTCFAIESRIAMSISSPLPTSRTVVKPLARIACAFRKRAHRRFG